MRVIAIEEHVMTPAGASLFERFAKTRVSTQRWTRQLQDVGDLRLAEMDAAGIDLQVLSTPPTGLEELDSGEAVRMAIDVNDALAAAVDRRPDRFAAFAVLPVRDAVAAATELQRTVTQLGLKGALINGHSRGQFLDDHVFWPIFEQAEALGVPIYLHPTPPPPAVAQAYYSGLPASVGNALALAGWGWHCETGMHALRLVLGGVFDRFPGLRLILGHMGENIPFSLARADEVLTPYADILRPVGEYFRENFYITTSGYTTFPPLLCAMMVLGVDRIMFAADYPYSDSSAGTAFLASAPISEADRHKIASENAERLLGI